MRKPSRLLFAVVLCLVFASVSLADDGIIHGDAPAPQPTPAPQSVNTVIGISTDAESAAEILLVESVNSALGFELLSL
jgi:hypothetical protein